MSQNKDISGQLQWIFWVLELSEKQSSRHSSGTNEPNALTFSPQHSLITCTTSACFLGTFQTIVQWLFCSLEREFLVEQSSVLEIVSYHFFKKSVTQQTFLPNFSVSLPGSVLTIRIYPNSDNNTWISLSPTLPVIGKERHKAICEKQRWTISENSEQCIAFFIASSEMWCTTLYWSYRKKSATHDITYHYSRRGDDMGFSVSPIWKLALTYDLIWFKKATQNWDLIIMLTSYSTRKGLDRYWTLEFLWSNFRKDLSSEVILRCISHCWTSKGYSARLKLHL